jgi:hypothetical protein
MISALRASKAIAHPTPDKDIALRLMIVATLSRSGGRLLIDSRRPGIVESQTIWRRAFKRKIIVHLGPRRSSTTG